MLKRISIFWIILIALLVTSALPLGIIALRSIESTKDEIEREQQEQLVARVDAQTSAINEQFNAFSKSTALAAAEAKRLLTSASSANLDDENLQTQLEKYQRDENNVFSLDNWYYNIYYPAYGDARQSNVFLNQNTELTPEIAQQVILTENLIPTFNTVLRLSSAARSVYITTSDGLVRFYPWQDASQYPPDWSPQTGDMFVLAGPDENPDAVPVWSAPRFDAEGTGVLVTNSVPVYDNNYTLIGVMSQELLITDLREEILGLEVGKKGYGFLLDSRGTVVAHKDYSLSGQPGADLDLKLAQQDSRYQSIVTNMILDGRGAQYYTKATGEKWLVVYSTIPANNWRLAMLLPYDEIVAPAEKIADQVLTGLIILAGVVIGVSVWLASRITRPVLQLSRAAKDIEKSVDAETAEAIGANLHVLSRIGSAKEIYNLASVFEQMVMVLQQRMNELNSIYAMGQAITSQVDFDQTLQAVLHAVQTVVEADAAEVSLVRGQNLVVEAWIGREDFNDTTGREYRIGRGPTGMIAASKEAVFIPVIAENVDEIKRTLGYATETGEFMVKTTKVVINSFLGIPLLLGNRLVGTLTLVHHESGHFTEDNMRQLNKLAAQASIAIDNAIQIRQRENALKAQIRELRVEIDQSRLSQQVEEITATDYFQYLQANAARMRDRAYTRRQAHSEDPKPGSDTSAAGSMKLDVPDGGISE